MSTALTKTLPQALPSAPLATAQQVRLTIEALQGVANVLTPTVVVDHIPAMHKVSFGVVFLGVDDVYGDPNGKRPNYLKMNERAPNKIGLMKVLAAAGGRVISSTRLDDRKDPLVCEFQVWIEILQLDGNLLRQPGTKRIDLRDGSPQAAVPEGMLKQQREAMAEVCESKATLRAIRAALALKQKYTVDELARPFIVPKLVADLDTTDPLIRQMVAAKALGLTPQLYGGPGAPALPAPAEPTVVTGALGPDDDEESPSPETGTGPAAVGSTAGPASQFPADEMSDAQRRHLFALARELRIPSVKVPHPTGERTALAPDEATMQALCLKGFVVVADLGMDAAASLIDRMAKLSESRGGHRPADDPPPPLSDEPMHVCACPCGCQKEIGAEQAQATRDNVGAPRCRACYPGRSFELQGHEVLASLGLPKYPNLTPAAADEWSRKQRGAA